MSADPNLDATTVSDDTPQSGIRSTSYYAKRIHRQHPNTSEPLPACGEMHRDADYKECRPSKLLAFQRWTLCENPECFGTDGIITGYGIAGPTTRYLLAERLTGHFTSS